MTSTTISEYADAPDEFVWAGGAELSRHDGPTDGIVEYQDGGYKGLATPAGSDAAARIKKQWAWSYVSVGRHDDQYQMAAEAWREASAAAPSACGSDRRRLDDSSEVNQ